ncbi:hypothetical protein Ssi02_41510 [Sinosporangium siamense]|uniref:Uncharacterized protein n=1 Tax=Sinosporangium siamense TaxID=1367973 RepID=A0A919RJE5_9ACTN|nr:hypothetical protein Ssi02_41510 [Sinosporangium siamense]
MHTPWAIASQPLWLSADVSSGAPVPPTVPGADVSGDSDARQSKGPRAAPQVGVNAPRTQGRDFDAWCHVRPLSTHVARVLLNPWSGLPQGAEEYLRYTAARPSVDPEIAARLREAPAAWDARQTGAASPDPGAEDPPQPHPIRTRQDKSR